MPSLPWPKLQANGRIGTVELDPVETEPAIGGIVVVVVNNGFGEIIEGFLYGGLDFVD